MRAGIGHGHSLVVCTSGAPFTATKPPAKPPLLRGRDVPRHPLPSLTPPPHRRAVCISTCCETRRRSFAAARRRLPSNPRPSHRQRRALWALHNSDRLPCLPHLHGSQLLPHCLRVGPALTRPHSRAESGGADEVFHSRKTRQCTVGGARRQGVGRIGPSGFNGSRPRGAGTGAAQAQGKQDRRVAYMLGFHFFYPTFVSARVGSRTYTYKSILTGYRTHTHIYDCDAYDCSLTCIRRTASQYTSIPQLPSSRSTSKPSRRREARCSSSSSLTRMPALRCASNSVGCSRRSSGSSFSCGTGPAPSTPYMSSTSSIASPASPVQYPRCMAASRLSSKIATGVRWRSVRIRWWFHASRLRSRFVWMRFAKTR